MLDLAPASIEWGAAFSATGLLAVLALVAVLALLRGREGGVKEARQ